MTPTAARQIETYLDDLARMLSTADPVLRAEVLGGVREHVEVALADRPGRAPEASAAGAGAVAEAGADVGGRSDMAGESDAEAAAVAAVLAELGPPEAVAAAALEGDGGPYRTAYGPDPGVSPYPGGPAHPAAPSAPPAPLAPPAPARPPALDRAWVPPTVGVLTLVTTTLCLLLLAALTFMMTGSDQVVGTSAPAGEGVAPLLPASYDVVWSVVALLASVGPLWLISVVLLAGSSLWSRRQKWAGVLLLPGVIGLNALAMAGALGMDAGTSARGGVLVLAWVLGAAATAVIVARLWRTGARRAR